MVVALAGISYKIAPVQVRERFAAPAEELEHLLPAMHERFGPVVLLSTCNRTEIYLAEGGVPRAEESARFLASLKNAAYPPQSGCFYFREHDEAVRHLFRVAAGLESMVLGEAQILGQVRGALLAAEQAASSNRLLSRLFQAAVGSGRKVRAATDIARYASSVSSAAVDLARKTYGDLGRCTVLVVSAGEAGKLTGQGLREAGAGSIVVASRTHARAQELAGQLGGVALRYERLPAGLVAADIVISATGARGFQIERPMIEQVLACRPERPLLLIDLAVPRDIDPTVREIQGVTLHDVDDLRDGDAAATREREHSVAEAEAILETEAARFAAWWQSRRLAPTIAALRDQAEAIRRSELTKTLGHLPNLSLEEQGRIDALTAAIVKKLLHQPITSLKALGDKRDEAEAHYLDTVRDLFALQLRAGADS